MNKVQAKLLELLVEFDRICQENDIKYVICGGNALGQERHGGFIPWDDDIDLFITRQEYIKLDHVMSELKLHDRAWVTKENSPLYYDPLARYVDLTTSNFVRGRLSDETPQGQMLELFILDSFPDDENERELFQKYLWLYCELLNPYYVIAGQQLSSYIVDKDLYYEYKKRMQSEGKEKILCEIEDQFLTCHDENTELLCSRFGGKAALVRREWMNRIEYRPFENCRLPFFKENIEYLYEMEYGYNWNQLPKKNNQVAHEDVLIINESIPYSEHWDHINQLIKKYGLHNIQLQNKDDTLDKRFALLSYQKDVAKAKNILLQEQADCFSKNDLEFSIEKLPYYSELFSSFFSAFFHQAYTKWNYKVQLEDHVFDAMCWTLIYRDNIDRSKQLIAQSENKNCQMFKEIVETIVQLKIEKYKGNIEKVEELLKIMETRFLIDKQIEVERCFVWAKSRRERFNHNEILSFYQSLRNQKDLEIKKYIGDMFYNLGDVLEASRWYKMVNKTNNGMIKKELIDKGFF